MQQLKAHRFEPLDGLRGISVLAVLAYHTANVPAAGRIGVDLFFVLSGFLITDIISRGYDEGARAFFPRFYVRRLRRLYPALVLACVLYAGLVLAFPWLDGNPHRSIVAALLMVSNYTQAAELGFPTALGHTWTLATEWQFYMLWPVAYFAVRTFGGRTRALLLTLGVAVLGVWASRYANRDTLWMWRSLDARGDGLLYGCMISIVLRAVPRFRMPALVTWTSAVAFGAIMFLQVPGELYWSNASAAVLIAGVITGNAKTFNRALAHRSLTYIGRISYGLYLYHFPLAALFFVAGLGPNMNLLLTAGMSIPLAALSWRFVERPILQLPHNRLRPADPSGRPVEGHG